ncbi:MAG: hypothetical protein ACLQAT_20150 [Candidatus Binataceae bacterium]
MATGQLESFYGFLRVLASRGGRVGVGTRILLADPKRRPAPSGAAQEVDAGRPSLDKRAAYFAAEYLIEIGLRRGWPLYLGYSPPRERVLIGGFAPAPWFIDAVRAHEAAVLALLDVRFRGTREALN